MGLPGSGKSTIASYLESDLKKHGIRTVSRSVELADNASFLWRHFRRFLHVVRNGARCRHLYLLAFRAIRSSCQRSPWDQAKVTWNFWSVIALMADCRAGRDSITIFDQGLFQAIWSVQLSSSKELPASIWKELLHGAGISDLLVVNVQSEIPVASNRLVARTANRTRLGLQSDDLDSSWRIAAGNMTGLIDLAYMVLPRDHAGDRVITIENDASCPRAAAAEIASAFLARAEQVRPAGFPDLCHNI
jgi:hypothetical protein